MSEEGTSPVQTRARAIMGSVDISMILIGTAGTGTRINIKLVFNATLLFAEGEIYPALCSC